MIWTVAARFNLGRDPRSLTLRELRWWYEGHKKMIEEERASGTTNDGQH